MYHLDQGSPTTGLRTGTGLWVIWYRAAQKEYGTYIISILLIIRV